MKQTKPAQAMELRSLSPVFDALSRNERSAGWPGRGHGARWLSADGAGRDALLCRQIARWPWASRDLASLALPVANSVSLGA